MMRRKDSNREGRNRILGSFRSQRQASLTKTRLIVGVTLAAIAIAGCGAGETGDPCKCPNLERSASSIDWLGDGTPPSLTTSDERVSEAPYVLTAFVELSGVDDGPTAQAAIAQRMIDAGFSVVDNDGGEWRFEDEEWSVLVTRTRESSTSDSSYPLLWVQIVDDDDRAPQILAPIVDALGTLP